MWFEELKKMKEKSGLTTKQIAVGANLPEPTLEKIFSGLTKDPKLSTIYQLVHYLGYTLDDLTCEKKAPASRQEPLVSMEASNSILDGLIKAGIINDGPDLSDEDLAFLANIVGILDAWFSRKR